MTNVSSQRFSTSAGSTGATITFNRAPPNVTIVSTNSSSLVTRRSPELGTHVSPHGTVSKQNGQVPGQTPVAGVLNRNGMPYSFGAPTSASHVAPPPPYSLAHSHRQMHTTVVTQPNGSATTVVYSGNGQTPQGLSGVVADQTASGIGRSGGMPPHVVKHTPSGTPPPPPLVQTRLLHPPNVRPPAPPASTSAPMPICPSTSAVLIQQSRPAVASTVAVASAAPRGTHVAQNVPPFIGPPPPLTSAGTMVDSSSAQPYVGSEARIVQAHTVAHRPIIPNHPGSSRGLSLVNSPQRISISSASGPRMIHRPTGPHKGQPGHTAPQGNPQVSPVILLLLRRMITLRNYFGVESLRLLSTELLQCLGIHQSDSPYALWNGTFSKFVKLA